MVSRAFRHAGADLSDADKVTFGPHEARILTRATTQVTVEAPGGVPASKVAVTVTGRDGHADGQLKRTFQYGVLEDAPQITRLSPSSGFARGGTKVRVEGIGLEGAGWGSGTLRIAGEPRYAELVPTRPGGPLALELYTLEHDPGTVDIEVTTALGVSPNTPADDYTFVPNLDAPVITSISPSSGPVRGGTVLTVRGRNLGGARSAGWNNTVAISSKWDDLLQPVSDTEVRVTTPLFIGAGPKELVVVTEGGGGSEGGPASTFQALPPAPLVPSPARGPLAGGNLVTLDASGIDQEWFGRVLFDGVEAQTVSRTPEAITVRAPAHAAGTGAIVIETTPFGFDTNGYQLNGESDHYTWTDDPGVTTREYGFTGTASLRNLTRGSFKVGGSLTLDIDQPQAVVSGTFENAGSSARLVALGFLPVTAEVAVSSSGATTGTLTGGKLVTKTKVRFRVEVVKLFGAIPLAGGPNCQTKKLSDLTLASPGVFDPAAGGRLSGTFAISDLNGCGTLNGLVSPLTAGSNNTMAIDLTPRS